MVSTNSPAAMRSNWIFVSLLPAPVSPMEPETSSTREISTLPMFSSAVLPAGEEN